MDFEVNQLEEQENEENKADEETNSSLSLSNRPHPSRSHWRWEGRQLQLSDYTGREEDQILQEEVERRIEDEQQEGNRTIQEVIDKQEVEQNIGMIQKKRKVENKVEAMMKNKINVEGMPTCLLKVLQASEVQELQVQLRSGNRRQGQWKLWF